MIRNFRIVKVDCDYCDSLRKFDGKVMYGSLSSFQTRFSDEISKLKIVNNYYISH